MRRAALLILDQRDLALAAALTLAALAASLAGVAPLVRATLAVPLVVFLPGYGIVHALFPSLVISAVERLLMSVGASISLTVLLGLVLAWTGIGLQPVPWALALSGVTLGSLILAWLRRARRHIRGPGLGLARMPRLGVLMVAIAALVVVNVVLGTRLEAGLQQSPPPAQLWMVPAADPADALVGVRAAGGGGDYTVRVSASGEVLHEFELHLQGQEVWEALVRFSAEVRTRPIVARLYEGDGSVDIRFVVLQPAADES